MSIDSVYQRDADKVKAGLTEVDGRLIAVKPTKILFPERWAEMEYLAKIEDRTRVAGFCFFVVDNKFYGQCNAQTALVTTPDAITSETIDGETYVSLLFDAGSTIMPSTKCVKSGIFAYRLNEEFMGKGKIPKGTRYDDVIGFYDTLRFHAGLNIQVDMAIAEFMASLVARNPKDRMELFSNAIKTDADLERLTPTFIALDAVAFNATNTSAKILGNYFQDGLTSALINESTRLEPNEENLRK